jgi:F-type H+-transporting ATPase subunit alpha
MATQQQIMRGRRILNTFIQKPNKPYSFSITIVILYALNRELVNRVPNSEIHKFEDDLRDYFSKKEKKLLTDIANEGRLTEDIVEELDQVLGKFTDRWVEEKGLAL